MTPPSPAAGTPATATGPRTIAAVKGLTLHPEHAELFRLGLRNVETRGWATRYHGPILLHASRRDPDSAVARRDPLNGPAMAAIPHGNPLPCGAIAAVADLVDCVPMTNTWPENDGRHLLVSDGALTVYRGHPHHEPHEGLDVTDQLPYGDFAPGRWAWILEDIRPLPEPVPCRGAQGLWNVPADVEAAVRAQLGTAVTS
jgi:hypothetical protein